MWIELNKKANYKILVFWIIIMDDKAEQKKNNNGELRN